jgi:hypothetical protein
MATKSAMKSFMPKQKTGVTVGEIVDAMHMSGEYAPLGREDIFSVVEIFLKEFVGMPGTMVTKKFTPEAAAEIALRQKIPLQQVVKIVTVFRIKAGTSGDVRTKMIKSFQKIRGGGGGMKSTPVSRM